MMLLVEAVLELMLLVEAVGGAVRGDAVGGGC